MPDLAGVIAAHAPEGARVLVVGPVADGAANGAARAGVDDVLPAGPFDLVVLADVLGLADEPEIALARARELVGEEGAVLAAEPDGDAARRDPGVLAAERRRRFTRETLERALADGGLTVVAWPAAGEGLLVARAVAGAGAAVAADMRRELEAARAGAAEAGALREERDALQARLVALEARERELRDRLLAAHELLATRDADVASLVESERELRGVQGTALFRLGWRYWRYKDIARRAAGRARRELRG